MCGPKPCDKPSCTWSERYRLECEARWVLTLDKDARKAFYRGAKAKRGELAVKQLIVEVKRQWNASQQSLL